MQAGLAWFLHEPSCTAPEFLPGLSRREQAGGGRTGGPLGGATWESELEAVGEAWAASATFQQMISYLMSCYLSNSDNPLSSFKGPPQSVIHERFRSQIWGEVLRIQLSVLPLTSRADLRQVAQVSAAGKQR